MWGKKIKSIAMSIVGLVLLFSYNNCSGQFDIASNASAGSSASGSNGSSILSGDLCEQDLMNLFVSGYYEFAKTNCSLCHTNGPGKGRFASGDALVAYNDFTQSGFTKFSSNATSSSHNPPYSGPQHVQTINELRLQWQKGLEDSNKCKGLTGVTETTKVEDLISFETLPKTTPAMEMNQELEMQWAFNNELTALKSVKPLPNLPGAKFSIKIAKHKNSGGDEYYTIRLPTIFESQVDLQVKGLHVKVNGILLKYPTTFKYLDLDLRAGTGNNATGLISTGSIVAVKALSPQDRISIVFEDLKAVTLPALEAPPEVGFSGDLVRMVPTRADNQPLLVDVELTLSKPQSFPITVSVSDDASNICAKTGLVTLSNDCLPQVAKVICSQFTTNPNLCGEAVQFYRARSVVGVTYNRFDWDYKYKSSAVTFAPGEISKTIRLQFSKDIRHEKNRLLTLMVEPGLGGATVGANKSMHFIFDKISKPTPVAGSIRFQDLMAPGTGILVTNCIKCHNSDKHDGGYDITNYEEMIANSVLVPGSASSKMYQRISPSDPQYMNLSPMPLQPGAISTDDVRSIKQWIEEGALNN